MVNAKCLIAEATGKANTNEPLYRSGVRRYKRRSDVRHRLQDAREGRCGSGPSYALNHADTISSLKSGPNFREPSKNPLTASLVCSRICAHCSGVTACGGFFRISTITGVPGVWSQSNPT